MVTSRQHEAASRVAAEITEAGGSATSFACDVSNDEAVADLVDDTVANHGRVDILVNNAGVIESIASIGSVDPTAWRHALGVNLTGAFHAIQAVVPHFKARGEGVIVNISSGAAHAPLEGWSAYCTSKAGLAMLTRAVDLELAQQGVFAYGFQPGVIDTDMQATIRASGVNRVSELRRDQLAPAHVPARLVALLCLAKPPELRGQDLSINDARAVSRIEDAARSAGHRT